MKTEINLKVKAKVKVAVMTLILLLFSSLSVLSANAATYYVATTGSDSNAGTEALPWKTIQKAADTMVAGDTVLIKEGVYFKDGTGPSTSQDTGGIQPKNSGSLGNPITFKAYPQHKPIIDQNYESMGFYIYQKNYITIDGLEIRNCWWAGIRTQSDSYNLNGLEVQNNKIYNINGPETENVGAIRPDDAVGAVIRNNYLYNAYGPKAAGIVSYRLRESIVENNEIWNAQVGIGYKAQYITGNITRYNYIHDTSNVGLWFNSTVGDTPSCSNHTVHNNIIYKAGKAISMWECDDGVSQNNKFYNNTFVDNPDGFFIPMNGAGTTSIETTQIWNNIIYNTVDGGSQWDTVIMMVAKPSFISLSNYNNFYETTQWLPISWNKQNYTFSGYQSASGFDANSMSVDPLFVDKANQNFRLLSNSPLKGKGLGGVDIGAYATGNEVIGAIPGTNPERVKDVIIIK